ncbi:MAG: DUF167 domain-containing protein [Halioglobus sp.]
MTSKVGSFDLPTKLKVKVVPGSSQSEVSGWLGDLLKVRVAAQPEKGKANSAVVSLLAKSLGLSKKNVSVTSGKTSQQKVIEVHGLSIAQIKRKLGANGA